MSWLLAAVLLAAPSTDVRIAPIEARLASGTEEALAEVERALVEKPDAAGLVGLDYLRGRLLGDLGRHHDASDAFLIALARTPSLQLHSYYWLAVQNDLLGHPETAAGLVARVVAAGDGFTEATEAARLLRKVLAAGGDCRLLNGILDSRLGKRQQRLVGIARARCAFARGDDQAARSRLLSLLREGRADEPAREAAELLLANPAAVDPFAGRAATTSPEELRLVGLTLHEHREFERSSAVLDQLFDRLDERELPADAKIGRQEYELRYARARNDFWLERYDAADRAFGRLAEVIGVPELEARAYFQQGRSRELVGLWQGASDSFRRVYLAEPDGSWASAALLSALRVEWRVGSEETALELYDLLISRRAFRALAARAGIFLASSELVRGRPQRAGTWLGHAARPNGAPAYELAYWRGRLAELQGRHDQAVERYLEVLRATPYGPFASAARDRLASTELAPLAARLAAQLIETATNDSLRGAWLLLGDAHPRGAQALGVLARRLARDPVAEPFLAMRTVPVAEWPIWQSDLLRPDDLLLALGLWDEASSRVRRHFPPSDPSLALTGSALLAQAGRFRPALYLAEVLNDRRGDLVPHRLLPRPFRQLLYPLAYRDLLVEGGSRERIDPFLLAAIIREESRFDPLALSGASARGLVQMTQPTAQQFAGRAGHDGVTALDLYRPEVSIDLGAAYLGSLLRAFRGAEHAAVAAYNAGEPQARLWLSYCYSREEPAEFYSKVGFRQTREYVQKVLTSRAQYREIYGGELAGSEPETAAPSGG